MLLLVACQPPEPAAAPIADAGAPVHAWVGEEVTLGTAFSQGDTFAWDPGDGSGSRAADALLAYTYDGPGHFTAFLRATSADGREDTDAVAVTVAHRPLEEAPRASGALASDGWRVFAVLPDADAVAVVDGGSLAVTHLATCDRPRSVSYGRDVLAVACEGDAVDLFTDGVGEPIRVGLPHGARPFGVVVGDGVVHVALQGRGALATVGFDGDVVAIDEIGPDLRGLAWSPARLVASRHRSPDAHGELWLVGDATARVTLAVDPGPDSDTNARGVPTYLQRVVVSPDGRVAYVGGLKANVARGLFRDGRALDHQTAVRADLRAVDVATGEELGQVLFDDRDLVSSVALSPDGAWLYATTLGAETVEVIDPWTLVRAGGLHPDVRGPDGVLVHNGDLWVLGALSRELAIFGLDEPASPGPVRSRLDLLGDLAEPLAAEVLAGQVVFTRSADPRLTKSGYVSCASCHLDGDADLRTWDFTDRGEGLRNTISLEGHAGRAPIHWSANFDEVQDFENDIRGPMAGAGFLSDADFAATSDPLGPAKAGRSADLDALAAYVGSLARYPRSPFRDADGALTDAAARGEALFLSPATGCVACHPPPTYTDSAFVSAGSPRLHDVGTFGPGSGQRLGSDLVGLDTPTLRGVWATPPFLHDGSAPTLRDVLVARNPADAHGVTSGLTDGELDDLVAFLASLE